MAKKISKTEAVEQIEKFFKNIKSKTPKEIKKIKKLAMSHSIKLGDKRKLFCRKCLTPFDKSQIRIKKGIKTIICKECGNKNRWKIKPIEQVAKEMGITLK